MKTQKPSPKTPENQETDQRSADKNKTEKKSETSAPDDEKGGFKDAGLAEPTRFGDWEVKGRCSDF